MTKQIGILGGNGAIGRSLTELLSRHKDIQIKISTRAGVFNKVVHHKTKYEILSLESRDDLKRFINGCDIVVNCTGFFNKNIIDCCLEYHSHYIDTSGELNLAHSERILNDQLQQKRLSSVQFVGANPGLTEVLVAYSKAYLNVDELELYFSGVGELSKSAVLEMIETSEPPYSYSQMYILNGKPEKLEYMIKEDNLLDDDTQFHSVPIINHHFINCIQKNNISKAYFFNAFTDKNIIFNMVEAKILHQNNQTEKAISKLVESFKKYSNDNKPYTLIKILRNKRYGINFRSSLDWIEITASVVYHTIILLLRDRIYGYGIKNLYEVIDSKDLLLDMKKNPKITIEVYK